MLSLSSGIRLKVSNYYYPILLIFFQKRRFSRYFTDKANAMVEIYRFSTKMLKILTRKLLFLYTIFLQIFFQVAFNWINQRYADFAVRIIAKNLILERIK